MAENKKSFIAYSDWKETFDNLSDEYAGKLIKHIFAYVNDENPESKDMIINAVFPNIKNSLKRDLTKWENQIKQRSEAGKRSAEIRATKINERSNPLNETVRNPTVSDNVSVSVNVNDNVILLKKETKNNIDERKLKFASTLEEFIPKYGRELIVDFYKYWTEPNKSNTKFKQEGEKTWSLERRLETWAKNELKFSKTNNQKSEPIVAGRQTMETIKKNLDGSNLYVPGI